MTGPDEAPPAREAGAVVAALDDAGTTDTLVGTIVGERYRVLERIGEGGMGAVYRAEHTLMKKQVAVKVLHPDLGRDEEAARRFEREAQSASRLSHENIIQVTDFGRVPSGSLFLVMELIRGESLAETLHAGGAMPPARAVNIARQILRGLEQAHAEGVVHRDLKPENIMLVARQGTLPPVDRIKILDFGIAKMSDDKDVSPGGATQQPLTQAGLVFGTPDYMSPEQAMGESADGRADLYACGVILYELLTGKKPFVAESRVAVLSMHLTRKPTSLRVLAPSAGISPALERVVLRAMEKRRDDRFPTANAFLTALDELGPMYAATGAPGGAGAGATSAQMTRQLTRQLTHEMKARLSQLLVEFRARIGPLVAAAGRELAAGWRRLVAAWQALPARSRRLAGGIAVGAAMLVVVLGFALRGHPSRTVAGPKPTPPDVAALLVPVERALANGDSSEAGELLRPVLAAHADVARVQYLEASVAFLEDHPAEGLAAYRQALRLDGGYRGDAAMHRNARRLLGDKRLGESALHLLVHEVGAPACDVLADAASADKRPDVRLAARTACDTLGCADLVDRFESYKLDLAQGKTCEERRDAVVRLRKLGDRRALEALKRAQKRRGGGLFDDGDKVNECIRKDLEDAIRSLEGK